MTELCEIFYKYKSDKCPKIFHSYSPVYFEFLNEKKFIFENIIEIGVGTNQIMKPICGSDYNVGASLKSWRDFFPKANVFELDIDKTVLFEEDRIKCFFTDQSDRESLISTIYNIKDYSNNQELEFDLIIDDGSHVIDHMILSFNTLSSFVKKGGYYIIEDIKKKDLNIYEKK